jgi:hypothetical protein
LLNLPVGPQSYTHRRASPTPSRAPHKIVMLAGRWSTAQTNCFDQITGPIRPRRMCARLVKVRNLRRRELLPVAGSPDDRRAMAVAPLPDQAARRSRLAAGLCFEKIDTPLTQGDRDLNPVVLRHELVRRREEIVDYLNVAYGFMGLFDFALHGASCPFANLQRQ